jgi:tetratricopeptide (TPR) repeat protein
MSLKPIPKRFQKPAATLNRDTVAAAAESAAAAGDWIEAASLWSRICDAFPDDLEAYVLGARALRYAGQIADSVRFAMAAVETFPDEAAPLVELGWSYWTDGDVDQAYDAAHRTVEQFPDLPDGYILAIRCLVQDGHFDAAEVFCDNGRELCPDEEALWIEHVRLPSYRGDWVEAARRSARLRQQVPDRVIGWTEGIIALREAGKRESAETLAEDAAYLFPDEIDPQIELAWLEKLSGDDQAVLQRCAALADRFPDDPRPLILSVGALRELDEIDDAEVIAADGLERFAADEALWAEWALLAIHRADWDEADARLAEIRERFPASVRGWTHGTMVLREAGNYEAAEALAAEGVERFPNDASMAIEQIQLAVAQQDFETAVELATSLRERFPEDSEAWRIGISVLRDNDQIDDAKSLAEEGLERFPDDFALANEWALISATEEDWEEAADRWADLRERFPDRSESYVTEILARRNLKQLDFAQQLVDAARERFPNEVGLAAEAAWIACDREQWNEAISLCEAIREQFPDAPQGYAIGTFALLKEARIDEADELITPAIERFPSDADVAVQYATTALERADWAEARRRWEFVRDNFPDRSETDFMLTYINRLDHITEIDSGKITRPAEAKPTIVASTSSATRLRRAETPLGENAEDLRHLLLKFESIGDNCEFGIVQTRFGAETLGLLRWGTIFPGQLIEMLDNRLEGVGLPENTFVREDPGGEYVAGDNRYFHMHTFINHHQAPPEQVHRQMCRRLSFLKEKFIEDLEAAEKIFVYKTSDEHADDQDLQAIWSAMQAYGPNRLLCIRPTEETEQSGQVELVAPRLMHGTIEGLTPAFDDTAKLDDHLEAWLTACRAADRIASAESAEQ